MDVKWASLVILWGGRLLVCRERHESTLLRLRAWNGCGFHISDDSKTKEWPVWLGPPLFFHVFPLQVSMLHI